METPGGNENRMWVCLYEMLGTFLLVLTLNWSMFLYNSFFSITPFAMGMAQFTVSMIWGDISGGNINAAVTLGVWFFRGEMGKNAGFAIMIMLSQITGAIIAVLGTLLSQKFNDDGTFFPGIAVLCPKIPDYTDDDMCHAEGQYG